MVCACELPYPALQKWRVRHSGLNVPSVAIRPCRATATTVTTVWQVTGSREVVLTRRLGRVRLSADGQLLSRSAPDDWNSQSLTQAFPYDLVANMQCLRSRGARDQPVLRTRLNVFGPNFSVVEMERRKPHVLNIEENIVAATPWLLRCETCELCLCEHDLSPQVRGMDLEKAGMPLILSVIWVVVACLLILSWTKRARDRHEMELYRITPEALHTLLSSNREVSLYDVRQPLELLIDSEIIPGATRIAPKEVLQNPSLIPKDKDAVVYCTCPGDETSRRVLHRALDMNFSRIKFLKGGLAGWKAKGYPVKRYEKSFHLDTRT
jgi:rhodanese-related sulfurtransferase